MRFRDASQVESDYLSHCPHCGAKVGRGSLLDEEAYSAGNHDACYYHGQECDVCGAEWRVGQPTAVVYRTDDE